jgi:hypothetical protein
MLKVWSAFNATQRRNIALYIVVRGGFTESRDRAIDLTYC